MELLLNKLIVLFCLSFIVFYITAQISYKFKLIDIPNKRKKHLKPTTYTGGIGLLIIYILIILLTDFTINFFNILLTSTAIISLTGFLDDKYNLNLGGKISLQLISCIILFYQSGIFLNDLGTYEIIGKLELGSFYLIFNIFSILLLINATNYLDGLDGSLTSVYISTLVILSVLAFKSFNYELFNFIILLIAPCLVFLLFNFSFFNLPKMFLGDAGSLTFGYILGFLSIYIYKTVDIHPMMLAWPLAFIVFEFLSVSLSRIYFKKKFLSLVLIIFIT